MLTFQFTVDLTTMLPHDETTVKPVETMTGTIEAEDYARAKQKAYVPIVERKQQIEREQSKLESALASKLVIVLVIRGES